MALNKIKNNANWGELASSLNSNFESIEADLTKVKNATTRCKGYFISGDELKTAYPSAHVGDYAYIGTAYPFYIWKWNGSSWGNTGNTGGDQDVNLENYYNKTETDAKLSELGQFLLIDTSTCKASFSGETMNVVLKDVARMNERGQYSLPFSGTFNIPRNSALVMSLSETEYQPVGANIQDKTIYLIVMSWLNFASENMQFEDIVCVNNYPRYYINNPLLSPDYEQTKENANNAKENANNAITKLSALTQFLLIDTSTCKVSFSGETMNVVLKDVSRMNEKGQYSLPFSGTCNIPRNSALVMSLSETEYQPVGTNIRDKTIYLIVMPWLDFASKGMQYEDIVCVNNYPRYYINNPLLSPDYEQTKENANNAITKLSALTQFLLIDTSTCKVSFSGETMNVVLKDVVRMNEKGQYSLAFSGTFNIPRNSALVMSLSETEYQPVGTNIRDKTIYLIVMPWLNFSSKGMQYEDIVCVNNYPRYYINNPLLSPDSDYEQEQKSEWFGKKIGFLGDSITEYAHYVNAFVKLTGCTAINYGVSGTRMVMNNADDTNTFEQRYVNMDDDLDCVVVLGGINDFRVGQVQFGDLSDGSVDGKFTFYAGLHRLFKGIASKYFGKPVIIMTPMHTYELNLDTQIFDERSEFSVQEDGSFLFRANTTSQKTLREYVQAIKDVAAFYSLPVIDLYAESGLSPYLDVQRGTYFSRADGLHHTSEGGLKVAKAMLPYMNNIYKMFY